MRWDIRVAVVLVAVALGALTVWSLRFFGRYQPFAGLGQTPSRPSQIGIQLQGPTVIARDHGHRRWRVSCRTLTFSRDWRQVSVDGITSGILFDAQGRPAVAIRAGHAAYDAPAGVLSDQPIAVGELRLDGGIRATLSSRPGFILQGDGLLWDATRGRARCLGTVVARYPGGRATGTDVTVDTRTGDLALRELRGTLAVPPEVF